MRTVVREVRYALRRLRGSPGFTTAATLTLAIAIGATASVFGVVDGVLLKAFPYRDPDRVLVIWETSPARHIPRFPASPANYLDWRAQATSFTTLAAATSSEFTVTSKREPERVPGFRVTPSYFPVLGITPALGRTLATDSAGPDEVVISYGYWQGRFGGSASVIGHTLTLDAKPYTIVGVMPAGIPVRGELWARLSFSKDDETQRGGHFLQVVGRLKPGVTPAGGTRELETIAQRLAKAYPETDVDWTVLTVPLLDQLVGSVRPALVMLLAAAACVLLIGAANLANLFLVRCLARQRELAVRTALGASRGRLVRELLAEAATLGITAGALGVGVAYGGVRALRALAPPTLPRLNDIGVDGRVVAFCALTSIATVLIFGMLPAWQASRGDLAGVLKEGGRGTGSAQRHRLQDILVVLQVAVALVLLTGAGLLVESFNHFTRMDPGFRPQGVLTAQLDLPEAAYPTPERLAAFTTGVVRELAAQPGVAVASASDALPTAGTSFLLFTIIGDPQPDPTHVPVAYTVAVGPEYFRTMGIAVHRGRSILATDDARAVKVAIVDEQLARQYFSGRDPVGQRVTWGGPDTATVVGVAAPVKQGGLAAEDQALIYVAIAQSPSPYVHLELRTNGDPEAETATLKRAVATVDRTVPVSDIKTMSARLAQSIGTTRFSSFLASLFAVVALILGMVGIYSVLSYIVSQRQREIGIRLALGASRGHVMRDVLRRALALTAIGIALGSAAAWWITRGVADLFAGVSPHDPGIFVGAALAFALVALVAAAVPALRTTRVNPVVALTST